MGRVSGERTPGLPSQTRSPSTKKNKNGFVRRSASKKESLSLKSFLQCTSSGAKQAFRVRMCESPLMRVAKKGAGCRA